MKDEEMAEEYTKKEGFRSGMFGELDNITSSEANKEIKQAFLAGLKVGRPQWHKVADGDLPKEQKEYWCKVFFYESEETFNAFLWFDINTKDFKLLEEIENGVESTFNIKEWCEIPTFDKEYI